MRITPGIAASQARALREALAGIGVVVRHGRALELVCAAHGLRSSGVLASAPEGDARPNAARLAAVAAPMARHDEGRLAAILATTTALTHPARAVEFATTFGDDGWFCRATTLSVPSDMPRDPDLFLETPEGTEVLAELAGGYYHTRYESDRSDPTMSLKRGSRLGEALLTRGADTSADEVYEAEFGMGNDAFDSFFQQGTGRVDALLDALEAALAGEGLEGLGDRERWEEALRNAVTDRMEEEDDSKASDLVGDALAEVVFVFGPARDCEGNYVMASGPSLSAAGAVPNAGLRGALASLGYTLEEYRSLTGNLAPTVGTAPRGGVRADKVVPWEAIREALDEASSPFTNLVLYAQVPVDDLEDLDRTRPIRFDHATFASYEPLSGTFFETARVEDVVVRPGEGFLETCHGWYGPDEICGLVGHLFEGRVSNVAADAPAPAQAA